MTAITLDLNQSTPWGNMSPGMREALLEAARVMLDAFHTSSPASGTWTSEKAKSPVAVAWTPATADMKRTHGNQKDATEDGAYALAVHVANHLGLRVLGRTPQGSGADWFLCDPAQPSKLMKLEVSGIAAGGAPGTRLNQKTEQGMGGTLKASGLAVVFRFEDVGVYSRAW